MENNIYSDLIDFSKIMNNKIIDYSANAVIIMGTARVGKSLISALLNGIELIKCST